MVEFYSSSEISNSYEYNINKNLELPHHELFTLSSKSPNVKQRYPSVVKKLARLAKTSPNRAYGKTAPEGLAQPMPLHLLVVLSVTSDAEEQYALLTIYWKCLGLQKANSHKYNKLTPWELDYIRRAYTAGKSIYSIAKALNRHPSTIYYALKRLGKPPGLK